MNYSEGISSTMNMFNPVRVYDGRFLSDIVAGFSIRGRYSCIKANGYNNHTYRQHKINTRSHKKSVNSTYYQGTIVNNI